MNFQFSIFNYKLKKRKRGFFQKKSSGSALIMTMIMIVNAVLIMSALTTISYRESKNSGLAKISAVALQGADSGMEWALDVYYDIDDADISTDAINTEYSDMGAAKVLIKDGTLLSDVMINIYFLDGNEKVLSGSDQIGEIKFIRSVATVIAGGGMTTSRALQAIVQE